MSSRMWIILQTHWSGPEERQRSHLTLLIYWTPLWRELVATATSSVKIWHGPPTMTSTAAPVLPPTAEERKFNISPVRESVHSWSITACKTFTSQVTNFSSRLLYCTARTKDWAGASSPRPGFGTVHPRHHSHPLHSPPTPVPCTQTQLHSPHHSIRVNNNLHAANSDSVAHILII